MNDFFVLEIKIFVFVATNYMVTLSTALSVEFIMVTPVSGGLSYGQTNCALLRRVRKQWNRLLEYWNGGMENYKSLL